MLKVSEASDSELNHRTPRLKMQNRKETFKIRFPFSGITTLNISAIMVYIKHLSSLRFKPFSCLFHIKSLRWLWVISVISGPFHMKQKLAQYLEPSHLTQMDTSWLQRQICVWKLSSERVSRPPCWIFTANFERESNRWVLSEVQCRRFLWIFCHEKLLFYKCRAKWEQYFSAANVCTEKNRCLDELKLLKLTSILHFKKKKV